MIAKIIEFALSESQILIEIKPKEYIVSKSKTTIDFITEHIKIVLPDLEYKVECSGLILEMILIGMKNDLKEYNSIDSITRIDGKDIFIYTINGNHKIEGKTKHEYHSLKELVIKKKNEWYNYFYL